MNTVRQKVLRANKRVNNIILMQYSIGKNNTQVHLIKHLFQHQQLCSVRSVVGIVST